MRAGVCGTASGTESMMRSYFQGGSAALLLHAGILIRYLFLIERTYPIPILRTVKIDIITYATNPA
jgi:TRAP-type mannitol/chloroaromatic compound transport system permease small subunit